MADTTLAVRVAALEERVLALEGRHGPRDGADVALLAALVMATAGRPFTASQVLARARVDPRLASALEDADIVSARMLGRWLARSLAPVRRGRGGQVWRVYEATE